MHVAVDVVGVEKRLVVADCACFSGFRACGKDQWVVSCGSALHPPVLPRTYFSFSFGRA